jgi:hypothetical protein
MEKWRSL